MNTALAARFRHAQVSSFRHDFCALLEMGTTIQTGGVQKEATRGRMYKFGHTGRCPATPGTYLIGGVVAASFEFPIFTLAIASERARRHTGMVNNFAAAYGHGTSSLLFERSPGTALDSEENTEKGVGASNMRGYL